VQGRAHLVSVPVSSVREWLEGIGGRLGLFSCVAMLGVCGERGGVYVSAFV
jgi:hypothetical protein